MSNENRIENIPTIDCRESFPHAQYVSEVDTKILDFQEVHCILLIFKLSTGEEETWFLGLNILKEVCI